MRRLSLVLVSLLLTQQVALAAPTAGEVRNFGPDVTAHCNLPEGIAAGPDGTVYASSLNFAATSGPANICVLDRDGNLIDTIAVAPAPGGVAKLLGLLLVPGEGLYVGDIGGGRVLRIDVTTHAATVLAAGIGAPNAFARDHAGNIYVSDSFAGSIVKIAPDGTTTTFAYAAQLAPVAGEFPPFGANGIAFDRAERNLYVAMTARDQIFRISFADGSPGTITLFATGVAGGALDGADGIAFDVVGNLYVASNQSDEVAALSPAGAVIAEYRGTGANAFNSPASLSFRGRSLYVANLALFHGGPQKVSVFTAPYPGAP